MSISLNNVNSEVVRAHQRIDRLTSSELPSKWVYIGKVGSALRIPDQYTEIMIIGYYGQSNWGYINGTSIYELKYGSTNFTAVGYAQYLTLNYNSGSRTLSIAYNFTGGGYYRIYAR